MSRSAAHPEKQRGPAISSAGQFCRALTKASRSNFTYAFLFLPRRERDALYAIYAFCRVTDDIVDEAGASRKAGPSVLERLAAWRAELAACVRGEASHPVTQRLAETMRTYRIPPRYFEELLDGVEMDLVKSRYATFAELEEYCHRVAGAVGLMCIEVFGYSRPETRQYAERLGTAFQLTNILRDLGTDCACNRLYLPQEDLARFGCAESDLFERRLSPAYRALMRFEVERARGFYAAAEAVLPPEDRPRMLPAHVMGAIYRRILERIEAGGYDVFTRRIRLSRSHRMALALGCWLRHRFGT
ncbi:MAG: presqualene diphosphate synthase HpnD [candidate division NC10 bacterium]|nr:presqualene diphosphate synthase HpnD [candidate division NC10 bacterium]